LGATCFSVLVEKVTLKIGGMTCANCARTIEEAVREVPGVTHGSVNLATEKLSLELSTANVTDVERAVVQAGYSIVHADADSEDEARVRVRRLVIAVALTTPLFVLAMANTAGFVSFAEEPFVELALATPIMFYCAAPFFVGAWKALRNRRANMDVLVATGTSAAFLYSLVITIAPTLLPNAGTFFETAGVIVTLILLGKHIEARSKARASAAIRRLFELAASQARVLRDGEWREIDIAQVRVGDRLLVKPGEKIPTDASVVEGQSAIDESLVTGESMPVSKGPGDEVIGATLNGSGSLTLVATRVGEETMLAQIVAFMEQAQGAKAPIERLVDRVTAWFVPVVLALALGTFAFWALVRGDIPQAFFAGIAVVIIACPCAMGLATPMAIAVGMGRGAERGILLKGAEALEAARGIDTVVMDKTGTLTQGRAEVVDIITLGLPQDEVVRLAAAAESRSEHPLAAAVMARAGKLAFAQPSDFASTPGEGVHARVEGRDVAVGRPEWLGVDAKQALDMRAKGQTVIAVTVDGKPAGLLGIADAAKPTSKEAVAALHARGLQVIMLTGDHEATAQAVALAVGVERVISGVKPQEKAGIIRSLRADGHVVMMVGDGVNDAIALAEADLGVAMGAGSDVAKEAGLIVLLRDDPRDVVAALDLSRATHRKLRQNLGWAFGYNVILIPLAMAGVLNPMLAAGAMALSSVSVVANSGLLRRWVPRI